MSGHLFDVIRKSGMRHIPEDTMAVDFVSDILAARAPVFDITNVWRQVASVYGTDVDPKALPALSAFPCCAPPFDAMWFEWAVRPGEGTPRDTFTPDAVACAVDAVDLRSDDHLGAAVPLDPDHAYATAGGVQAAVDRVIARYEVDETTARRWLAYEWAERWDTDRPNDITAGFDALGVEVRWCLGVSVIWLDGGEAIGPYGVFQVPLGPSGELLACPPDLRDRTAEPEPGSRIIPNRMLPVPFLAMGRLTGLGLANWDYRPMVEAGGVPHADRAAWLGGGGRHQTIGYDDPDLTDDIIKGAQDALWAAANRRGVEALAGLALYPVLQALAFMNCRNVAVHDVAPAPKVAAAYRKRHGIPQVRWKTIEVQALRRPSGGGSPTGKGAPRSFHIPAGHFAHYGDCCPGPNGHAPHGKLFGRLTGIYWVPPHVRGNRSHGVTVNDYRLTPETTHAESAVSDV